MILYSVSQVTQYIKELFDSSEILQDVLVEGEVSNFKQASSGHCYFTLKDASSEIRCVMWKTLAAYMHRLPEQGELVQVRGYVSVYERGGNYQLYVNRLSSVGAGDLWQRFLELKDKLEREGLFDAEHKKNIPEWPRRIGVVTSPTGAALRDIQNVIEARYPLVELIISPTLVQGVEAPASIVDAIRQLEKQPSIDVILVARGGGSLEDLWAFNDEGVARRIFDCPIPIITGVGHETDFTLADFCADRREPTPSAAAAAAVPDRVEIVERLNGLTFALDEAMQRAIEQRWEMLDRAGMRLERQTPVQRLTEYGRRLAENALRLNTVIMGILERKESLIAREKLRLEALNPRRVLERGYALVSDMTGKLITRRLMVVKGQVLEVQFADGDIEAAIVSIADNKDEEGKNDDR